MKRTHSYPTKLVTWQLCDVSEIDRMQTIHGTFFFWDGTFLEPRRKPCKHWKNEVNNDTHKCLERKISCGMWIDCVLSHISTHIKRGSLRVAVSSFFPRGRVQIHVQWLPAWLARWCSGYHARLVTGIPGRRGFESCSGHVIILSFQRQESKTNGKLFTSFFQYLQGFIDSRKFMSVVTACYFLFYYAVIAVTICLLIG